MSKLTKFLITFVVLAVPVIAWLWFHPYNAQPPAPKSTCTNNHPCYKVTMPNEPALYLNSWRHFGSSNCIDFTSLPDGQFHGYCGIYSIGRVGR